MKHENLILIFDFFSYIKKKLFDRVFMPYFPENSSELPQKRRNSYTP